MASSAGVEVTRICGGHLYVSVGSVANEAADRFVAAFEQALTQPGGDVVVDLGCLESCDRDIANALIRSREALAELGRRLVLVNVRMMFRRELAAFSVLDRPEPDS